jgi:hypothetical protein
VKTKPTTKREVLMRELWNMYRRIARRQWNAIEDAVFAIPDLSSKDRMTLLAHLAVAVQIPPIWSDMVRKSYSPSQFGSPNFETYWTLDDLAFSILKAMNKVES